MPTHTAHFWVGLAVLDTECKFICIGGTALLTEPYQPNEETRVQGFSDTLVFATMAVPSSSAGLLVNETGWEIVNFTAIAFVTIALIAGLWLVSRPPTLFSAAT